MSKSHLRKARVTDAAAIFDLIWSARDNIPLRPSFDPVDNRQWIANECPTQAHI
jgi:hypothetical protein